MKKVVMSLAIAVLAIVGVQGQENKTIKKESTVERVVTKEGSKVSVKEIKNTNTESGAVIVEGNDNTNQQFNESSMKDKNSEVLVDEMKVDEKNESLVRQQRENLVSELENSERQQKELAAQKMKSFQEKQLQMKREMAERQAALESRPKGMSRLKKD